MQLQFLVPNSSSYLPCMWTEVIHLFPNPGKKKWCLLTVNFCSIQIFWPKLTVVWHRNHSVKFTKIKKFAFILLSTKCLLNFLRKKALFWCCKATNSNSNMILSWHQKCCQKNMSTSCQQVFLQLFTQPSQPRVNHMSLKCQLNVHLLSTENQPSINPLST